MQRSNNFNQSFGTYFDLTDRLTQRAVADRYLTGELAAGFFESGDQVVDAILSAGPVDQEAANTVVAMIGIDLMVVTQAAALATWGGEETPSLEEDLESILSLELIAEARQSITEARREISSDELGSTLRECRQTAVDLLTAIRDQTIPREQAGLEGGTTLGPGAMPRLSADTTVNGIVNRTASDLADIALAATSPLVRGLAAKATQLLDLAVNVHLPRWSLWSTASAGIRAATRKLLSLLNAVHASLPDDIQKFVAQLVSFMGQFTHDALDLPLAWKKVLRAVDYQLQLHGAGHTDIDTALNRIDLNHRWARVWMPYASKGLGWVVLGHPAIGFSCLALLVVVTLLLSREYLDAPGFPDLIIGVRRAVGTVLSLPPASV